MSVAMPACPETVFPMDLTIDNVGDLPRITIDQRTYGGDVRS